jgi:hypothetical protein
MPLLTKPTRNPFDVRNPVAAASNGASVCTLTHILKAEHNVSSSEEDCMKRSPRSPRTPANLSDSTNRKLNMYALAASAAGVGMLASTLPAEAKIVYTKMRVEISPQSRILNLDLNHDGVGDFTLSNVGGNGYKNFLEVLPGVQGNAIWGAGKYASALDPGVRIGPKGLFQAGHSIMAAEPSCYYYCSNLSVGPWKNTTSRYLGLKFLINGEVHFGWARFNVTIERGFRSGAVYAALTGYAYETVPNRSIVAGETKGPNSIVGTRLPDPVTPGKAQRTTATLGMLARGAQVLDIWRKRNPTEA